MNFGVWDYILMLVVSVQSTFLAYLHHPRWKALLLSLPLPFTCAFLAVGKPIDTTNVAGMFLLLLYTHGVRVLHLHCRVPVMPAIAISALGYCAAGTALAQVLPATPAAFWTTTAAVIALAVLLHVALPARDEPGHRTALPVWVKMPIMILVVALLMLIKHRLGGFTTMFPMVSIMASYEARHSMWTICRQIPLIMLTMGPMMAVMYLAQDHLSTGFTLALGWIVLLGLTLAFNRDIWRTPLEKPSGSTEHVTTLR